MQCVSVIHDQDQDIKIIKTELNTFMFQGLRLGSELYSFWVTHNFTGT